MMSCMFALIPLLTTWYAFIIVMAPRLDIRDSSENIRQTSVSLTVVDRIVPAGLDFDAVIGQCRRDGALQRGDRFVVIRQRLRLGAARLRKIILAGQYQEGGGKADGKFRLLSGQLLLRVFARGARRAVAQRGGLDRVICGAHVGFDGLKLFAQLGVELAACFEGAAQICRRSTIAKWQRDVPSHAPGRERVVEEIAERRTVPADESGWHVGRLEDAVLIWERRRQPGDAGKSVS